MWDKIFKFLIDVLVLNTKWTSLGAYMVPERVTYSSDIEAGYGGYCKYFPFHCTIVLRPKYKGDMGILTHERVHARQYGRLFWVHSGLTLISGWYTLLVELEAYRAQVLTYRYTRKAQYDWIVASLDKKYNTGVKKGIIQKYADYAFRDLIREDLGK